MTITSVSRESRLFPPPEAFAKQAKIGSPQAYEAMYRRSVDEPDAFWLEMATSELSWFTEPTQSLDESNAPHVTWFADGTTNLAMNCLDRHVKGPRKNKAAIIFEGEPGDVKVYTFAQLHREVCRFANVLKKLNVAKGDRVAIYMGMVPEAAIAMLACARIGAVHTVIFGGFAAEAVRDRVNDAGAKVVVTQDGAWRRGSVVPLKANVDLALEETPTVKRTVVLKRTGNDVTMTPGRDHWWHEVIETIDARCEPEVLPAEHPLFILYTSGTTGKPKGVLHTTAGYLLGAHTTSKYVFDLQDEDVYWCTADVGWVTGHSYIVYGPLANGSTIVMYEGAPNQPKEDRFWEIIAKYKVTILYTAPTAIRAFIKWGDHHPKAHDLRSLRLLGSVGEPINPEAWMWYHEVIGGGRCPIVDTWWQTETGAIMITPLPGATPTKPGSATKPLPGIQVVVVNKEGEAVPANAGGFLVVTRPWPSMMRTIYGDDERYKATYWSHYPNIYFTADGARMDDDGDIWIMGRVDDVLNVSGHRLSTMEVESALVNHPAVAEAAVVGKPDDLKGESIFCFVTVKHGIETSDDLKAKLKAHVAKEIGALARPDEIRFTETLPKTRSGKIMRRLLRDIAAGRTTAGDTTTLEDIGVLAKLREDDE